jgi:hypothetical protein
MAAKPSRLHTPPPEAIPLRVDQLEEIAFLSMTGHRPDGAGWDADARRVVFVFNADARDDLERFRAGMARIDPLRFIDAMRDVKKIVYGLRKIPSASGGQR